MRDIEEIYEEITALRNSFRQADLNNGPLLEMIQRDLACAKDELTEHVKAIKRQNEILPELRTQAIAKRAIKYMEDNKMGVTKAKEKARSETPYDDEAEAVADWAYMVNRLKSCEGLLTALASTLRSIDSSKRYNT